MGQLRERIDIGEAISAEEIRDWIDSECPEYLHESVRQSLGQFADYVEEETLKKCDMLCIYPEV